ncbi:hypothetical protein ACFL27_27415 [candidate division CSSED10-310 bacterium]|uniref:Uncharacterized protein n=1 Tax=candidate division CSSED10-310 bacterium TaxID=2855610 RepID=A0ABV6Z661_UNCC1
MKLVSKQPQSVPSKHASEEDIQAENSWSEVLFARLLIGIIILMCAEVFSGASLPLGLWHPWTLSVTYWLYFAHFFFFTTLAVRTGRTSLSALYLWGVLCGLYESWITKVIWHGFSGDGKLAMGNIGPYGFAEISMVFIFHPMMSFILPLAVTCLALAKGIREWSEHTEELCEIRSDKENVEQTPEGDGLKAAPEE